MTHDDTKGPGKGGEAIGWQVQFDDGNWSNALYTEDEVKAFKASPRGTVAAYRPLYSTPPSPSVDRSVEGLGYTAGVRDGIEQALEIALGQAVMMADLALEGHEENARVREAMEAALTRFSQKLRWTLEALASPVEGLRERVETLEAPQTIQMNNSKEDQK